MGDAYSDMNKAVREHNTFIDSIPDIINTLKTKSFNEMTTKEHDEVGTYYRYTGNEITSKINSTLEWYFKSLTRNHFDAYIGNDKLKDYTPHDVPPLETVINRLQETIDLLKRTVENKP